MAFRSTHTRPTKTTLYEFDFSTKKLTIINQLLDSELRLGNVYSRIEAYPVIKGWDYAKLSADFYSIFIHKYLFSVDPYKMDYSRKQTNEQGLYYSYNPDPQYGD
jgi:hypothetical protein